MIAVLLILIPLLTGIFTFFIKAENAARSWAFISSLAVLGISIASLLVSDTRYLEHGFNWMPGLGSRFAVSLDGMGKLLCLLTAIGYPLILLSTWRASYKKANNFFGLLLLTQAGLMGVFLAADALLFYFFWELALIPVYFLCSQWGGERRIAVTFKFFIYTFIGSLLMLIGILYIYAHTKDQSFAIASFYDANLSYSQQSWLFWLLFIAFAIKMPIFPFHTWQPDTYEQSPTPVTMVLSGIMVKMGVFAVLKWLLPVLPLASYSWGDLVSSMAVTGMLYASLIAMRQDDMKRLIAYSSIAHIGLMCIAIFSENKIAFQGVMVQMFNHGINIIGLWIIVELIERQFGTRRLSDLGGIAQKAPGLAILFVIIALANIALPLTNAFIGEFMMFVGIFTSPVTAYGMILTVLAGLCIILGAAYTLYMVRKALYGEVSAITANGQDIRLNEKIALGIIVAIIVVLGVYPAPLLGLTDRVTDVLLKESDVLHLLKK